MDLREMGFEGTEWIQDVTGSCESLFLKTPRNKSKSPSSLFKEENMEDEKMKREKYERKEELEVEGREVEQERKAAGNKREVREDEKI